MENLKRSKRESVKTVKVDRNSKLEVDGFIIDVKELMSVLTQPNASQDRKTAPVVVRKYLYALEWRNTLQSLLNEMREVLKRHRYIERKGNSFVRFDGDDNLVFRDDTCIRFNNANSALGVFPILKRNIESQLIDVLEQANQLVEKSRKDYEESIYFVSVA